jgi:hypothetical protein
MFGGMRRSSNNGAVGTANEQAMETVAADTYLPDSQDAQEIESMLGAPLPDANAVRAFLVSSASDHLRVSIPEHHVKRSGLRHRTVYTVATQVCPTGDVNSRADAPPPPATVEREMADFTALFKGLELRFKGVFLPPLPAANSFLAGSPSEKHMKQQAASLEFALSVVARSPFLSSHRIFREFATSTGAFDKKHASSATTAAKEASRADVAVRMWHGALRLLNPPKNRTFARSIALLEVQEQLKVGGRGGGECMHACLGIVVVVVVAAPFFCCIIALSAHVVVGLLINMHNSIYYIDLNDRTCSND